MSVLAGKKVNRENERMKDIYSISIRERKSD